jgi:hypothetical protein
MRRAWDMPGSSRWHTEPHGRGSMTPQIATLSMRVARPVAPVSALSFVDEGRSAFKSVEETMHR